MCERETACKAVCVLGCGVNGCVCMYSIDESICCICVYEHMRSTHCVYLVWMCVYGH